MPIFYCRSTCFAERHFFEPSARYNALSIFRGFVPLLIICNAFMFYKGCKAQELKWAHHTERIVVVGKPIDAARKEDARVRPVAVVSPAPGDRIGRSHEVRAVVIPSIITRYVNFFYSISYY